MEILVAIGHILGTLVALFAIGMGQLLLAGWDSQRNQEKLLNELSLELGIHQADIDRPEYQEKIMRLAVDRFSSELFRNRLSDFCGLLQVCWGWLGNIVVAGILIGVIWSVISGDIHGAVAAWFAVVVLIFFSLASIVFSLTCKLLTGRYPGQAKGARKALAGFFDSQGSNGSTYPS